MSAARNPQATSGSCQGSDSIAVVGLACRLPGDASDPEHFWEMLCKGRSAYSEFNRYNVDAFQSHVQGKLNTSRPRGAHFLREDIAAFDANFFTINEQEATAIDPQARIMLEVAYEAFENAGLPVENVAGTSTSCYVGSFTKDYREMTFRDPDAALRYSVSGTGEELISNRLSWFYDLRGPSFTLNTACSSSLVALHQGCQSLQSREAEMSVVGGCNLLLNPDMFLLLSNLQFLARDGRSKSFDAKGDGYGRGEGFAAVVLKRVEDAIRDGDPIRAIIRGTGVNQDGHTKGITVPSADAQASLIRSIYARAGLDLDHTHYIECHGTGTKAGDPVELEAISKTLASCRKPGKDVLVGSVKPNIGHLEATAGLAGLIKAIYILERGIIPPNILFDEPNPQIPFKEWKLSVPTTVTAWPTNDLRRVSVQGFGYGGTNAHAVLEDATHYLLERGISRRRGAQVAGPTQFNKHKRYGESSYTTGLKPSQLDKYTNVKEVFTQFRLFILSAHDKNGLERQRESLRLYLQARKFTESRTEIQMLRDLAFTLSEKRSRLTWKTYVFASSLGELEAKLQAKRSEIPASRPSTAPRLGFVFTGQGSQWARMGIELSQYTIFRQSIEESDTYLRSVLACPWSAVEELFREDPHSQINNPAFSQPLCTVLQIALVDLLESWNIVPSTIVGHSSGEIAGAYCLGALTKENALKAAYYRGLLATRMKVFAPSRKGAMLAVGASESQAQEWLNELNSVSGQVVVGCVNSPSSVTLSGDASVIDELQEKLQQKQVFARKLKVDTAYHSPHLETVSRQYFESLRDIQPQPAHESRRMYSSVTGSVVESSELGAMNWVRNLVSPVLFYDAVHEMLRPPHAGGSSAATSVDAILEVGPHSTLQGAVNQTMRKHDIRDVPYLSVLSRGRNAAETAVAAAAALFAQGVPVNVDKLNTDAGNADTETPSPLVDLPPYAWNHSRTFWAEPRVFKEYRQRTSPHLSLLGAPYPKTAGSEHLWRGQIRMAEQPWIQDHKIQTSILYPAAGFIAMAVEASFQIVTPGQQVKCFCLRDIQIVAPAVLDEDSDLECIVQLRPRRNGNRAHSSSWMEFSISSCHPGEDLRQNCFGLIHLQYQPSANKNMSYEDELEFGAAKATYHEYDKICGVLEDPGAFYTELSSIGLNYGSTFQNMTKIRRGRGKSCFTVTIPNVSLPLPSEHAERPHIIHPTNLDAMFHGVFAAFKGVRGHLHEAMVPTSIDEITISAQVPFASGSQSVGFCEASEHGFRELVANISMFDQDLSSSTVTVKGFHCSGVAGSSASDDGGLRQTNRNMFSKMIWKPAARFLTSDQVCEYTGRKNPSASLFEQLERCESLAVQFVGLALEAVSISQVPNAQLQDLYFWMQSQQRQVQDDPHTLQDVKAVKHDFLNGDAHAQDNFETECVEGKAIRRLGRNITRILLGQVDARQILLEGGLIHSWFSELMGLDECFEQLAKYIDLLAHQDPALSILEIAGSSRGSLSTILPKDADASQTFSFARYVFSSSTYGDSEEAEQYFDTLKNRVEFKTLAIDKDPNSQGFNDSTFDLIVCSALELLYNAERVIANARKLLKPGGRICLAGMTKPGLRLSLVLHCLQLGTSDEYVSMESKAFENILARHGLRPEFSITDFESTKHQQLGIVVAAPSSLTQNGIQEQEAVIVEASRSSEITNALGTEIAQNFESHSVTSKRIPWGVHLEDLDHKEYICFIELGESLLENISEEDFTHLKRLVASPAKLLWVTSRQDPRGSLVAGMARSIRNEMPGKQFYTVSIQNASLETSQKLAQQLVQLVSSSPPDSEFLEEDGVLKICRVVEDAHLDGELLQLRTRETDWIATTPLEEADGPQKLAFQSQAMLESVCLETDDVAATTLENDEVEIEVKATGMNFRDVIAALGQIPDNLLGFDASGVVTRVGEKVDQFKAGDRVCTLGHGTHRTHFRNKADFCQILPEGLSFEVAATLPLVHATAFHALINVGRIRPEQTILIHAGAGGVGQAAIQLAQHFGLDIFVTVGSSEKRDLIMESYKIPEDHIFNSRDLSFAMGVRRMTKGRGVDCILNSLSGQALQETWRCIAPFGTFVEIGIRDILDNTGLEMRPFIQDATFSFLNLKHVMVDNPKLLKEILQGTFDFLRQGVTRPVLPVTTYPISSIEDAFRLMQTGKHLGKIAISWGKSEIVPVLHRPRTSTVLSAEATYVLCGGFGGLGQSLAHMLVRMGAQNLCFISRSGDKSVEARKLVEKLEQEGVRVVIYSCDIASKTGLADTLHECSQTMPVIKGVVQCAMVLRDISFGTMTHNQWTESLRPKVQGTWNLHSLLPPTLDFFITLSSFAGIFGNRTQSNYAAAGAFQDALAHYRVARGLKAVTIDLGIMRDVGVIATHGSTGPLKEWEEPFGIREVEFHQMMTLIITKELDNNNNSTTTATTTNRLRPQILTGLATGGAALAAGITTPYYFDDPRFSHLALSGLSSSSQSSAALPTSSSSSSLPNNFAHLASTDSDAATACLTTALVARIAKSLQTDVTEISELRPLHSYGVDSLVAIEISNWLHREINVAVTVFEVLAGIAIGEFAEKLVVKCRGGAGAAGGSKRGDGDGDAE